MEPATFRGIWTVAILPSHRITMLERIAQFVFVPEPGPSVLAAWIARVLFPPRKDNDTHRDEDPAQNS
jgi:hypothetical protein